MSMTGTDQRTPETEFVFFAHDVADLKDNWRRFSLSAEDIAMLNPNTGTMATFRSVKDAEITKGIYRRVPVLIQEEPLENPWDIRFSTMFHMSNDSDKFRTREELEAQGYTLEGNHFVRYLSDTELEATQQFRLLKDQPEQMPLFGGTPSKRIVSNESRYLPLYEGKYTQIYDHRASTFEGSNGDSLRDTLLSEHLLPEYVVVPRYWVEQEDFQNALPYNDLSEYWLTFHDIANPNNERTFVPTICPFIPLGNKIPALIAPTSNVQQLSSLYSCTASLVFDFVMKLKIGGRSANFYIVKQLPIIPPYTYTQTLMDFIFPRVLELSYTAWDLQPFAQDVGYQGAPFVWDEERRFLMRCELDALYFHLYQIGRDDVDYIMETFPIVKRKDIKATSDENGEGGEYITKNIILEMYDQMGQLPKMAVPAPKDERNTYDVPDVSQWQTWLNPPPADPSVAHPDDRR